MAFRCHVADVVEWASQYESEPFHALLCDPPYHLQGGFMNAAWDKDGPDAVAFRPETWAAFASVLYPGAFGMAFASSRGWHRLACAIEDAGMRIHPSIFGWSFGSGFPKATRVQAEADGFDGHRYGLQAMKPALEPVIVFQKPYAGRPVDSITATGAGALNIDGGRVGTAEDKRAAGTRLYATGKLAGGCDGVGERQTAPHDGLGRWPANLALVHHPECNGTCHLSCPVARLDAQSGTLTSGTGAVHQASAKGYEPRAYGKESRAEGTPCIEYGDTGGASRFFFQAQYDAIDASDPVCYAAKASRAERDAGLADGPDLIRHRVKATGMERDPKWAPVIAKNDHTCVKPISLTRWLATLLLPPIAYAPRRLFNPFSGSGSEAIGADQAGWEVIEGVEMDPDHARKALARVTYWHAVAVEERRVAALQPSLFDEVAPCA